MITGKVLLVLGISAATLLAVAGCKGNKPAARLTGKDVLYKYQWNLISLEGTELPAFEQGKEAHMLFYSGREETVKGSTGCNRFSGVFKAAATDSLTFQPLVSTRMFCPNTSRVERALLNVFNETRTYSITGDTLKLKAAGITLAAFKGVTYKAK